MANFDRQQVTDYLEILASQSSDDELLNELLRSQYDDDDEGVGEDGGCCGEALEMTGEIYI